MAKNYIDKCSASLAIKKMQIKTTVRFHLTPVRSAIIKKTNKANAGEDVGGTGKEPSYAVGGYVNYCNHYGNQYGGSSKN
jgi:hypothetical protein